jgi:hypothetical protein
MAEDGCGAPVECCWQRKTKLLGCNSVLAILVSPQSHMICSGILTSGSPIHNPAWSVAVYWRVAARSMTRPLLATQAGLRCMQLVAYLMTLSGTPATASNGVVISDWWAGKDVRGRDRGWRWYYRVIRQQFLRETMMDFRVAEIWVWIREHPNKQCEVWVSHSGVAEDSSLPGCYSVSNDKHSVDVLDS